MCCVTEISSWGHDLVTEQQQQNKNNGDQKKQNLQKKKNLQLIQYDTNFLRKIETQINTILVNVVQV